MTLNRFVNFLISYLSGKGVSFCVLRNYEKLPDENIGGDIDILVQKEDIPSILESLEYIEGIFVTNVVQRSYVYNVFFYGVKNKNSNSIQIDFVTDLVWKGLKYLDINTVLKNKVAYKNFFVPASKHEAIISLMSSLLNGNIVKKKYLPKIMTIFREERDDVLSALSPTLTKNYSRQIVESICTGNIDDLLINSMYYKRAILKNNFGRELFHSLKQIFNYYKLETKIRFRRKYVVLFLGPMVIDSLNIIAKVKNAIKYSAKPVLVLNPTERKLNQQKIRYAPSNYFPPNQKDLGNILVSLSEMVKYVFTQMLSRPKVSTLYLLNWNDNNILTNSPRQKMDLTVRLIYKIVKLIYNPILWVLLIASPQIIERRQTKNELLEIIAPPKKNETIHMIFSPSLVVNVNESIEETVETISLKIAETLSQRCKITLNRL